MANDWFLLLVWKINLKSPALNTNMIFIMLNLLFNIMRLCTVWVIKKTNDIIRN